MPNKNANESNKELCHSTYRYNMATAADLSIQDTSGYFSKQTRQRGVAKFIRYLPTLHNIILSVHVIKLIIVIAFHVESRSFQP